MTKRKQNRNKKVQRSFKFAILGGLSLLVIPILALYMYAFTIPIPTGITLNNNSLVVDQYGRQIGPLTSGRNQLIESDDLPNNLVRAVLAAEDKNYYEHNALSWVNLIGALVENIKSGNITRGGSTITQQYVKNTYIENPQRSYLRKIRESAISIRLENTLVQKLGSKQLAKDHILTGYLNTIYFGHGLVGADAAARYYYAKSPKQLSELEAATLAGMIRAPSFYETRTLDLPSEGSLDSAVAAASSDAEHRYDTVLRRNEVLEAMASKQWLANPGAINDLQRLGLGFKDPSLSASSDLESICLMEKVRSIVQTKLGTAALLSPGLKVQLTLSLGLQAEAQRAAEAHRPSPEALIGLVAIDPQTGAIRAIYDNCNGLNQYNIAVDAQRQIASTIKPIVIATALKNQLATPVYPYVPGCLIRSEYTICNDDKRDRTNLSVEAAIAQSNNPYFVVLSTTIIGLSRLYDGLFQQGVTTGEVPASNPVRCPLVPALAIGACERSVLAMASAYGTWSNEGSHAMPYLVSQVTSATGAFQYQHKANTSQAMPASSARRMNQLLTGVIERTDGTAYKYAQIGRPAAGKTGTSSNNADAWFIGYVASPNPGSGQQSKALSTAVWVGYDDHRSVLSPSATDAAGASVATPIWQDFMASAMKDQPVINFTQ